TGSRFQVPAGATVKIGVLIGLLLLSPRIQILLRLQALYRSVVAYASTFEIRCVRSSRAARGPRAAERERTRGLDLVPAGTRHPHAPPRGRSRAGDWTSTGGLRRARS